MGIAASPLRSALIVVNYRTGPLTVELVAAVVDAFDEVVVVDNSSALGDLADPVSDDAKVRVIRMATNVGYGAAANVGARECTSERLVVANPDVKVRPESLVRLVGHLGEGIGLVAPRFVRADGDLLRSSHRRDPGLLTTLYEYGGPFAAICARVRPGWHPTLRPAAEHDRDHDTLHVLGALFAVDAELFRRIGGFDERYLLYREETDLCRKVRAAGLRVRHVASVEVVHYGQASTPGDRNRVPARPLYVLSHYRYIARYQGALVAALAWFVGLTGCVVRMLTGPGRGSAWRCLLTHLRLAAGKRPELAAAV